MTFKMLIYNELQNNLDTFVDYLLNMVARQFCCLGDFCLAFQCCIWFYNLLSMLVMLLFPWIRCCSSLSCVSCCFAYRVCWFDYTHVWLIDREKGDLKCCLKFRYYYSDTLFNTTGWDKKEFSTCCIAYLKFKYHSFNSNNLFWSLLPYGAL